MTDFPDVKLKALVNFPATVLDGTGIDIAKSNGSYQFNLDFGDFAPPVTGILDPSHQNALLWNNTTDTYTLANIALLGGSSGIPDAPVDGTTYGRKNAAWAISVPEAPIDHQLYARVDAGWTPTVSAAYVNSLLPVNPVAEFGLVTGTGKTPTVCTANTAAIASAAAAAVSRGVPMQIPRGVVFEVSGGTTLPANCEFDGNGSTMRLGNNLNSTMFVINGASRNARKVNVRIHDIILDGNAQNQTGQFYPFAWWNVSGLTVDRMVIMDFWATAMNGNDLDQEGTYSGNPVNLGGTNYNVAATPGGEQTSDTVRLRNITTFRTAANLTFANSNPTMWQGDQFVVGKVNDCRMEYIRLQYSGQNGLALQFLQDAKVIDFRGTLLARGIYLETCHNVDIVRPELDSHMMINNTAGNTADTFGIWMATGDQSYTGVPYGSCDNIRIRDPYIHNFQRTYSTAGTFRAIVINGNNNSGAICRDCSVRGARIRDIDADVSAPKRPNAIMLGGSVSDFDITDSTIERIGNSTNTSSGIELSAAAYGSTANNFANGSVMNNRVQSVNYPFYGATTTCSGVAIAGNSWGSTVGNVAYPASGTYGTSTNF